MQTDEAAVAEKIESGLRLSSYVMYADRFAEDGRPIDELCRRQLITAPASQATHRADSRHARPRPISLPCN